MCGGECVSLGGGAFFQNELSPFFFLRGVGKSRNWSNICTCQLWELPAGLGAAQLPLHARLSLHTVSRATSLSTAKINVL